jgi:hypothetical protein
MNARAQNITEGVESPSREVIATLLKESELAGHELSSFVHKNPSKLGSDIDSLIQARLNSASQLLYLTNYAQEINIGGNVANRADAACEVSEALRTISTSLTDLKFPSLNYDSNEAYTQMIATRDCAIKAVQTSVESLVAEIQFSNVENNVKNS